MLHVTARKLILHTCICMIDNLMEQFRESSIQGGSTEKKKKACKLHVYRMAKITSVHQLGSSSHLQRIEHLYIAKENVAANTIANHLCALGNFVSFLAYNDCLEVKFTEHMKEVFIYKREQFLKPINKKIRIETAVRLSKDQGSTLTISVQVLTTPVLLYRYIGMSPSVNLQRKW